MRQVLPGELAKHAVSEGTKAVQKYNTSQQAMTQKYGVGSGCGRAFSHRDPRGVGGVCVSVRLFVLNESHECLQWTFVWMVYSCQDK